MVTVRHAPRSRVPAVGLVRLVADAPPATNAPAATKSQPAAGATTRPVQVFKDKDGKVYPAFEQLAQLKGDPKVGAAVFRDVKVSGCVKCHQVGDEGGMIGPPLTVIGDKLQKPQLYEAIFTPSASILMEYETWLIKTKDGDVQEGLKVEDTPDHVTLKDSDGKYHDFKLEDIAVKKMQPISLMPEGLPAAVSQTDMVNLVEYLSTLKNQ